MSPLQIPQPRVDMQAFAANPFARDFLSFILLFRTGCWPRSKWSYKFWRVTGKAIWSRTEPLDLEFFERRVGLDSGRHDMFWIAAALSFADYLYILFALIPYIYLPYFCHPFAHRHLQRPLRPHMKVILRMVAVRMRIGSTPSRVSPFESRS